jgi:hypothetical protein
MRHAARCGAVTICHVWRGLDPVQTAVHLRQAFEWPGGLQLPDVLGGAGGPASRFFPLPDWVWFALLTSSTSLSATASFACILDDCSGRLPGWPMPDLHTGNGQEGLAEPAWPAVMRRM